MLLLLLSLLSFQPALPKWEPKRDDCGVLLTVQVLERVRDPDVLWRVCAVVLLRCKPEELFEGRSR